MKKILILFLLIISASLVFADDPPTLNTLGSASKMITAYKRRMSGSLPEPELQLRLLDPNDSEFSENYLVDLPLNARDNEYVAFTWVLSGNIYHQVSLEFTFGPMTKEGSSTNQANRIIPYDVKLAHTQTRIGNTPIRVGGVSNVVSFMTNNFTDYKYKYADNVTGAGTVAVSGSQASKTMAYDMSEYTKVYNASEVELQSYPLEVCDYWNRYGSATVTLKIGADGKRTDNNQTIDDGVYYANVKVVVIIN